MKTYLRVVIIKTICINFLLAVQWIESTHSDFIDGEYDPAMFVSKRTSLEPDSGCIEFIYRFDADNNGYIDLLSSDYAGPYLRLFWGSSFGYSSENSRLFPISRGGDAFFADLNFDGNPELVHSTHYQGYVFIYWGTPSGPLPGTYLTILNGEGEDVNTYDIDKNGYLDIIIGGINDILYIYWGNSSGYSSSNSTKINIGEPLTHNISIADLDKNGFGDIVLSPRFGDSIPIVYWEPNNSYYIRRIPFISPNEQHGKTIADLDRDGWLDIVATTYQGGTQALVYWGSSGFQNYTLINPGNCTAGAKVVDWNQDGWLDLVFVRFGGGFPIVYLNTGTFPFYNDTSTITFGPFSIDANGCFVADFNYDGFLDVFIGGWSNPNYVLFGPNYNTYTPLSGNNDHHANFSEIGNFYDRSFSSYYFSSIFDAGIDSVILAGTCYWIANEPPLSNVLVYVRTGDTSLPDTTWTNFYQIMNNGDSLPQQVLGKRYIQYKIVFQYENPSYLPYLEKIEFNLTLGGKGISYGLIIEPDTSGVTQENVPINYNIRAINTGSFGDTVLLSSVSSAPGVFSIIMDSSETSQISEIWVDSGATRKFLLKLIPPESISDTLLIDTTVVYGNLQNNPSVKDSAIVITQIKKTPATNYYLIIEPDTVGETNLGDEIIFPMRIRNINSPYDSVSLSFTPLSQDWDISIKDTSGNNIQNIMVSGTSYFLLSVLPLPSLQFDSVLVETVSVYGQSLLYSNVKDSARVIITVFSPPQEKYSLDVHNYASPFKGEKGTNFVITLPENGKVEIIIYDRLGAKVKTLLKNEPMQKGKNIKFWDSKDEKGRIVSPGTYIYIFKFKGNSGFEKKIIKKTGVLP